MDLMKPKANPAVHRAAKTWRFPSRGSDQANWLILLVIYLKMGLIWTYIGLFGVKKSDIRGRINGKSEKTLYSGPHVAYPS